MSGPETRKALKIYANMDLPKQAPLTLDDVFHSIGLNDDLSRFKNFNEAKESARWRLRR